MANKTTIANNGLTIIENYNKMFEQIAKAKTVDDVRAMVATAKEFISVYKTVDKSLVNKVYEKLQTKLNDMIDENEFVYSSCKALSIRIVIVTVLSSLGVMMNFSTMQNLHFF